MDNNIKFRINTISNHFGYFRVPKITDELVYFEIKNNIVTIKINNLKNHNLLNNEMIKKINEILKCFGDDESIHCFIITGSGDKYFCNGVENNTEFNIDFNKYDKPIIAAINGSCRNEGVELAILCDMVIASDHSTFFLNKYIENKNLININSSIINTLLNSKEAYDLKIVNKLISKESLLDHCYNISKNIGNFYHS